MRKQKEIVVEKWVKLRSCHDVCTPHALGGLQQEMVMSFLQPFITAHVYRTPTLYHTCHIIQSLMTFTISHMSHYCEFGGKKINDPQKKEPGREHKAFTRTHAHKNQREKEIITNNIKVP